MKRYFKFFMIFSLLLVPGIVFTQTNTWEGNSSTLWTESANWSLGHVPLPAEDVAITSLPVNQPMLSGVSGVCNNFTLNSGATLTISATPASGATLTVSGTATFYGTLSIGGIIQTGKLITGNIVWAAGSSMSGLPNGAIEVSGNWEFSTGSTVNMGDCGVLFTGSNHSHLISNSINCRFWSVTNGKSAGYNVYLSAVSTSTLKIDGTLTLNSGTKLFGDANITIILGSSLVSSGNFYFNAGTVSMEKSSGTQVIQVNPGDYFNSLKINGGSTVSLNNNVDIHNDFIIQSGTFDPVNFTMNVGGNWVNSAGPEYFIEGTGKVVFNGVGDNQCSNSEKFNLIEVNHLSGNLVINNPTAVVTCNQYNWTAGGISVLAGTFTALDLTDNGIYGYFGLQTGGNINLTNNDSFVDLSGNLNISGGTFNVYGGNDQSYWPYNKSASITMSNGILNFVNQGIRVQSGSLALNSNITGGTIMTSKGFSNYRADFNPAGGAIELYGPTDAGLYCVSSAALCSVKINKSISDREIYPESPTFTLNRETGERITDFSSTATINLTTSIALTGDFTLLQGTFNSNNYTMQVKGNWNNTAGPAAFNEGIGKVVFNGGSYDQYCSGEEFYMLDVDKVANAVNLTSNMIVNGILTVKNGTLKTNSKELATGDNININSGGTLWIEEGSLLKMTGNKVLTVNSGGMLKVIGLPGSKAVITRNGITPNHLFFINGTISAKNAVFEYNDGLTVGSSATIDPVNPFDQCTFQNGGDTYLVINNNQELMIREASFLSAPGYYNVSKLNDAGHVTFIDASGDYAGATYENDPYNRVDWISSFSSEASAAPQVICAGSSSQLNLTVTGGLTPYTYSWSPATDLTDPSISNPVASPPATSTYYVTVTDVHGRVASSSVLLTVNPVLPVGVNISASSNPVPPGTMVTFTATTTNGGDSPVYQWKVNNSNAGAGLATYSYIPHPGDEVICTVNSNAACTTGNPAISNNLTMIVVPADLSVGGSVMPGTDTCFNASNSITVPLSPDYFTIHPGGTATFIAGVKISYLPGTTVYPGGYLHGFITSSNHYCGSIPPAMVSVVAGEEPVSSYPLPGFSKFSIYPNPATEVFTILNHSETTTGSIRVEIFDLRGNIIASSSYSSERKHLVTLPAFMQGLYFVKVNCGCQIETFKLVVMH